MVLNQKILFFLQKYDFQHKLCYYTSIYDATIDYTSIMNGFDGSNILLAVVNACNACNVCISHIVSYLCIVCGLKLDCLLMIRIFNGKFWSFHFRARINCIVSMSISICIN